MACMSKNSKRALTLIHNEVLWFFYSVLHLITRNMHIKFGVDWTKEDKLWSRQDKQTGDAATAKREVERIDLLYAWNYIIGIKPT